MLSESAVEALNGIMLKSEAVDWLRELDILDQAVYKTEGQVFDEVLEREVGSRLAGVVRDEMRVKGAGIEVKSEIVRELRVGVNALQEVKLEVAIELPREMLRRIHKWLRENISAGIVMEVVMDKEILVGVRITSQGKYADLTAQKDWPEVWKQVVSELVTKAGS
jgi:hypothetical protein